MTRIVPVTVLVLLAASGVASAQAGSTLPSGATVVFEHRKILGSDSQASDPFFEPQSGSTDLLHYFNLAHCNCARAATTTPKVPGNFQYFVHETKASGGTNSSVSIDLWVGSGCADLDAAMRVTNCLKLGENNNSVTTSIPNVDAQSPYGDYREFNLYQVVNGKLHGNDPCIQDNAVSAPIYAFMRANSATQTDDYDYKTSLPAGTLSSDTGMVGGVDTAPPPLPDKPRAIPGDGTIHLSWSAPAANAADINDYQALCATAAGDPLGSRRGDPKYVTTAITCPGAEVPSYEMPTAIPLDNGGMTVTPRVDFLALDARFLCGTAGSGTATSLDIKGLQNGIPYQVMLVAVDLHGNFKAAYFSQTISPVPSTDLWEDIHENHGSDAEGGLCLLAETYGDDSGLTSTLRAFRDDTLGGSRIGRWLIEVYYATVGKLGPYAHGSFAWRIVSAITLAPLVAVALLWHWLTLPGLLGLIAAVWLWRRRGWVRHLRRMLPVRRASLTGLAAGSMLVLGAGHAYAGGGGYQPYWENGDQFNDQQPAADDAQNVTWNVGIRVGPYVPNIDNQLGLNPGPYQQMFPGTYYMPMLDVDRILWSGFGQVGVGVSLGYLSRKDHTFVLNSDPNDPMRPRAGDLNRFRLIPTAVTAIYRFTWLDDEYGIPVVPYARAGVAYYIWWISVDDHYARVCNDGSDTFGNEGCPKNKALGASLGVQGSIGLAVRAERIDASAAVSMRQSGIQHAGVYAELSLAKVDGFGSSSKLSVGDRTWFAGVNFEF